MTQQFHCWVYTFNHWKQGLKEISVHHCSLAALFTVAKRWKQHKCLTDEGTNKLCYIYLMELLFSLEKEENPDTG